MRRTALRVLAALLLFELTLRAVLWIPGVLEPLVRANPTGVAAELLWTRNWLAARWSDEGLDDGAISPAERHDPELGWVPWPGRNGAEAHGLRGPDPVRPGATVVALVGDSFAWGSDVTAEEGLHARMEARRDDLDVKNLGVPGYGHDQMWRRLARQGPRLHPDAVVLLAIGDDVPRASWDWFAYARPRFRLEDGRLQGPEPSPSPWQVIARTSLRPRAWDLWRAWQQRYQHLLRGDDRQRAERLSVALLDAWRDETEALGAVPVVVFLPSHHLLDPEREAQQVIDDDRALYQRWCARQDFVCIDGTASMRAHLSDPAAGMGPAHWTPAGYDAGASVILQALVDAGVVPPL